jgi:hypothetical protein
LLLALEGRGFKPAHDGLIWAVSAAGLLVMQPAGAAAVFNWMPVKLPESCAAVGIGKMAVDGWLVRRHSSDTKKNVFDLSVL